jgi:hypothetical protein
VVNRLPLARTGLLGLLAGTVTVAALVGLALRPADPAPASGSDVDLASVLTATVELPRLVRDPRTAAVLVRNHGTVPVRVHEVQLVTESFAPTGPFPKDVEIPPGVALALSVIYGEGRCGGRVDPPLAPATARLVVSAAGGAPQTLVFALPDADDRLAARLHAECAAQLIASVLTVRLEGWSTEPNGDLRTTLVVERRSGREPVTLHQIAGSVLYRLAATGSPIGELPAGERRLEIPVTVEPERCDAHAMADAKFPYLFRTWLSIGELDDLPALIATDRPGQDRLVEMWHSQCGV